MSIQEINIDLGFLEPTESWKLESRFFPSKTGGKPAWLEFSKEIPSFLDLKCKECEGSLTFMCQVYAPIDANTDCFHRTLFIFICKNENCCLPNSTTNMKVYRCQLNRNNNYYPSEPPVDKETWRVDLTAKLFGIHLCKICGARSSSHCAKCKSVYYCSKQHQLIDWKNEHKAKCNCDTSTLQPCTQESKVGSRNNLLFPEYELITETEELSDANQTSTQNHEEEILKYTKLVKEGKAGTLQDVPFVEEELSKFAFKEEDETFTKFNERIKYFPDQVLRYNRGGKPLWISASNQVNEEDIPPCQYCSSRRVYEFQILPQMLNYLNLETSETSIDWGVLAVYTCENSCNSGPGYKEEFIWKQDIASTQ